MDLSEAIHLPSACFRNAVLASSRLLEQHPEASFARALDREVRARTDQPRLRPLEPLVVLCHVARLDRGDEGPIQLCEAGVEGQQWA